MSGVAVKGWGGAVVEVPEELSWEWKEGHLCGYAVRSGGGASAVLTGLKRIVYVIPEGEGGVTSDVTGRKGGVGKAVRGEEGVEGVDVGRGGEAAALS